MDALEHYDVAVRLAPEVVRYRATLGERARYLGLAVPVATAP
jgi:hypothetical protein